MQIPRLVRTAARLGLPIVLGAVAALSILFLIRSGGTGTPTTPEVGLTRPVSGARVSIRPQGIEPNERRSEPAERSGRPIDAAAELEASSSSVEVARNVAVSTVRETSAPVAQNDTGKLNDHGDAAADADDSAPERPLFWCFSKTQTDHDYVSDSATVWNGSRSVWIGKNEDAPIPYFSVDALWQGIDATPYRGARIEISAQVKGKGYFQFFLRTASATEGTIVLTNQQLLSVPMTNRYVSMFPPNGGAWTRISLVGEIPSTADIIYYGLALHNGGAIWMDNMRLSQVNAETPTTEELSAGGRVVLPVNPEAIFSTPTNLDFEITSLDLEGESPIAPIGC